MLSIIRYKIDKNSQDIGDRDHVHPVLKEFWFKVPAFLIEGDFRPIRKILHGIVTVMNMNEISPFVIDLLWSLKERSEKVMLYVPIEDVSFLERKLIEKAKGFSIERNKEIYLYLSTKKQLADIVFALFGQSLKYALFYLKDIGFDRMHSLKDIEQLYRVIKKHVSCAARDIDGEVIHLLLFRKSKEEVLKSLKDVVARYQIEIEEATVI